MSADDLIIAAESTPGTWVTPDTAFPVDKVVHNLNRNYIEKRLSGKGRFHANHLLGGIMPSGSIEMDLYPDYMGLFLQAAGFDITTTTPGGATNARLHGCLPSADRNLGSLSAQVKRSASVAMNILRMTIAKLTLKAVAGNQVTVAMDYVAKDEAVAGANWNYTASSSEAVISSPTYIGATLTPYLFYNAALVLGGTVSLDGTTKQYSISGGSAFNIVESLEVMIDNDNDQFHTLQSDPTVYGMPAQDSAVTVKMDLDWSTIVSTYYGYFRDGTNAALKLTLTGAQIESGQNYLFEVVIPNLSFTAAEFPDVEGSSKRRKQTVEAVGNLHAATDFPIGVAIKDTQTSY